MTFLSETNLPFQVTIRREGHTLMDRWDVKSVAASLGFSERWVTTLCRTGQLAAIKQGRVWLVDPVSVEDFRLRGVNAA